MKDRLAALKGPDNNSDAEQERDLEANGGRKASGEGKGSKRKSGSGFLKKGSDAKEKKKEQQAKEEEAKKASFLKEFLVEVEKVKQCIAVIEGKVEELKTAHARMLSSEEPQDKDTNEVEELNGSIRREASDVRSTLKKMETETDKVEESNHDQVTVEVRIRKIQQSTLSRNFIDTMTEYNRVQNVYRDGCKKRMKKQLDIMGKPHDDNELEEMIRTDNPNVFNQQLALDSKEGRKALTEVELRHKILKLERSLQELHELFLDMARLVEQQGEAIDRIDYNVEQSCRVVANAKVETKKAVKYQKAARKKKIIIACVVVGIILVVILIVVIAVT
ncbi:syntaxin-1A-like [Convolutriloba macropyga]|uniref:syntaxin-1A-like n=1 Tax=Convolutriloba macropyga TaxID=536237 RepID=UPI003F5261FD